MCAPRIQRRENFLIRVCRLLFQKKKKAPPELQSAINDCTTLQELIELLFTTDYTLDEAMITAFDHRFAELEQGYTIAIYQTINPQLKTYNNGSRTV